MKTFKIQIITPHGKVFDSEAAYAVFPGQIGEFGVLPGHSSMISLLSPGVIEITGANNAKNGVAINWGYAAINEEGVIVLVDGAVAVAGSGAELTNAIAKAQELVKAATDSSFALGAATSKLASLGK